MVRAMPSPLRIRGVSVRGMKWLWLRRTGYFGADENNRSAEADPTNTEVPMRSFTNNLLSRRDVLRRATLGFGALAMSDLLARASALASAAPGATTNPLAAAAPHFAPRAKRVIYI